MKSKRAPVKHQTLENQVEKYDRNTVFMFVSDDR